MVLNVPPLIPTDEATRSLEHPKAWGCAVTNLLVMPGLGTLVARQRHGWIQLLLSSLGLCCMLAWLAWFLFNWIVGGKFPTSSGPYGWVAVLGVGQYVLAWSWSGYSSLQLFRQTSQAPETRVAGPR